MGWREDIYLLCIPGLQITAYSGLGPRRAFPGMLLFPCLTGVQPLLWASWAWAAHSECSQFTEYDSIRPSQCCSSSFGVISCYHGVTLSPGPVHLEVLPARLDPGVRPEATAHLISFCSPRNPELDLDNLTYPKLFSSFWWFFKLLNILFTDLFYMWFSNTLHQVFSKKIGKI